MKRRKGDLDVDIVYPPRRERARDEESDDEEDALSAALEAWSTIGNHDGSSGETKSSAQHVDIKRSVKCQRRLSDSDAPSSCRGASQKDSPSTVSLPQVMRLIAPKLTL